MVRISVGEALGAGFRLIGREPLVFVVWCVVYVGVQFLPSLAVLPFSGRMAAAMATGDEVALAATQNSLLGFQFLFLILLAAAMSVLAGAIIRATLFPEERRFFYLRVGLREFWIFVVTIVLAFLWMLVAIVTVLPAMLLAGVVGFVFTLAGGPVGAFLSVALSFVGLLGGLAAAIWVMLRFSLAPAMSFAENAFRLTQSWSLTRGHGWRLFLLALGYIGILLLGYLVLFGAGFAALVGSTPNFMETLQSNPEALFADLSPVTLVVASVVIAVFGAWVTVVGTGAWANVYRQLKPQLAETFA